MLAHKYDSKTGAWLPGKQIEVQEGEKLPANYTTKPLPVPNWKPVFNKDLDAWVETATEEEKNPVLPPAPPSLEDQVKTVKQQLASVLMQNAQKDVTIKNQAATISAQETKISAVKTQNASIMLTLAKNGIN